MQELKYPLFDGKKIWDGASVIIEDGVITSIKECDPKECGDGLLMPGLIDAHTHMESMSQVERMLKNGITATCDVNGSWNLIRFSEDLKIVSSAGMAMGLVINPKGFVEKAVKNGAKYIKVLLFSTVSIGKPALTGIVKAAHSKGLKVAVHATEISTVKQTVDAGADILLHVPMKEAYPEELAETIAEKGIAVAPTLVMMETFAKGRRNGYRPEQYVNAENAVRLLHKKGVTILTATDANSGSFAPAVSFGPSIHREMELLQNAGLTSLEVLKSSTSTTAEVFGIEGKGFITEGEKADMILVGGRPDKKITDTADIRQVWAGGRQII